MTVPDLMVSAANMDRLKRLAAQRVPDRPLTNEETEALEANDACSWCGGHHVRACPRVKKMEWTLVGGVPRMTGIEFWPDSEVNWDHVVFTDEGAPGPVLPLADVEADLDTLISLFETDKRMIAIHSAMPDGQELAAVARRLRMALELARTPEVRSDGDSAPA
jgi:hypothetical protein